MTTLNQAIEAYRTIATADGKSPFTVEWVIRSASYFARFLGGDLPLEEFTPHRLREWIADLRSRPRFADHPSILKKDRPLSPSSISNYVRGVKLLITTLMREGIIADHPLATFRAPKLPKLVVRPYTEGQLKAIFQALGEAIHPLRNRAMVALLLDSCLRLSEMVNLRGDALDLERREMRIWGKGDKERVVPMGSWAAKQLLLYRVRERPEEEGGNLFVGADGQPLDPHAFQQMLRRLGGRLGFRVHPHAFRHTGAIMYVRNGGDPLRLQHLLGHTDLTMTKRYCAIVDADLTDAHRKFSPGDRLRL